MSLFLLTAVGGTLLGCKPPVDAPAELGELTLYLYENFDGDGEDGEEALVAGAQGLVDYMEGLNMTADTPVDDRAVTLPMLPFARLGSAVAPSDADEALQVPVAVSGYVAEGMDVQVPTLLAPNQVCIASDTTVYHAQTFPDGDADAFAARDQERLVSQHEFLIDSFAGDAWLDVERHLVWVTLEDGRELVLAKGWMDKRAPAFDKDNVSWDQRFELVAWIPDANSGSLRFYGMWSSVTGLGDDLYASSVKSGLDEHYMNTSTFAEGGDCNNDRDREYDRGAE